ncbi:MAG: (d)CMP kinase [Acidobacteriaceae bacterium]
MVDAARGLIIAIDGPAGAGKSTLASRLARHYGYLNIETGAMYRALALKAIENDISVDDGSSLCALAAHSSIKLQPTVDGNRVILDTVDISNRIREKDVTEAASRVSVHPEVRAWMVSRQREMGKQGGVVMEGRDIGTAVFPHADVKIFLDAAPEVRGNRRYQQTYKSAAAVEAAKPHPGPDAPAVRALADEMRERDQRDRTRAISPLIAASDAITIDSTQLPFDEVMARAKAAIDARLNPTQSC